MNNMLLQYIEAGFIYLFIYFLKAVGASRRESGPFKKLCHGVFFYRAFTCNIRFLWHEELIEGGLRQAFDVSRCDFHFVSCVPLQRLQHGKVVCSWNQFGHPLFLFILEERKKVAELKNQCFSLHFVAQV